MKNTKNTNRFVGVISLLFFSVTASTLVAETDMKSSGFSCDKAPKGTIFCDDFESGNFDGRYFESSPELSVDDVGRDGSKGVRVSFKKGISDAGSLKKSFGITPNNYVGNPALNKTIKYDDIYWRIDLRTQPGWIGGGGDKLSRVTSLVNSDWAQGAIGHIWSSGDKLVMDPASGINADGKLVSTKYNDFDTHFDNLRWLGSKGGNVDLFSTENSGKWYCIEAHVKLNTPGKEDGLFEFWIDDTLQAKTSDLNWHGDWNSNPDNLKLNVIMIENYWNKGPPVDQERYMDNFVISTSRIGCDTDATVDVIPPVITLQGKNPVEININTPYTDSGATASDNLDGDISTNIVTDETAVDIDKAGTYGVIYTVSDTAGNTETKTRTVEVIAPAPAADTQAPVITLSGASTVEIIKGTIYVDAGATATDNIDGTVTVTSTGGVDITVIGTYVVSYRATDAAGNTATKTRTVKVLEEVTQDTTKPVITLLDASTVTVAKDSSYIELGASALDDRDGAINVVITGAVDTSKAGTYILTYTVTDTAGNTATKTRTVEVVAPMLVVDTQAPIIALTGAGTVEIIQGFNYVDAGAAATDNVDNIVIVTSAGEVDTAIVGTYIITFTAIDAAGNISKKERTVIVKKAAEENNNDGEIVIEGVEVLEIEEVLKGGAMGYLLLPLIIAGLCRRRLKV